MTKAFRVSGFATLPEGRPVVQTTLDWRCVNIATNKMYNVQQITGIYIVNADNRFRFWNKYGILN